MVSSTAYQKLADIHARLRAQEKVEPVKVRFFIRWFGAERRGLKVACKIRKTLERAKVKTVPDFLGAHIDAYVRFELEEPPHCHSRAPFCRSANTRQR